MPTHRGRDSMGSTERSRHQEEAFRMTRSFIATIKVKPGHEADFEALARKLVTSVNTNERGCLLYTLNKGEDPLTFVFMERYVDEEAVKVGPNCAIYIPPRALQFIENTGSRDLEFLCIVDPAWRAEDEEVLDR